MKSEKWWEREGEISGEQRKRGRPRALPFALLFSDSSLLLSLLIQSFFFFLLSVLNLFWVAATSFELVSNESVISVHKILRVCVLNFFPFFFFFTGDNFYSYTAPDEVLSLLVLKPSSKHFPLPVQRWISLEECTTTDSHFLLDMTELPLLGQLI